MAQPLGEIEGTGTGTGEGTFTRQGEPSELRESSDLDWKHRISGILLQ